MNRFLKRLKDIWSKRYEWISADFWRPDVQLSRARAFSIYQIQLVYFVVRSFFRDRLLIRASALVYATLLSIVPILALMFSLLKAFGFHNKLEPALEQFLHPLGEEAVNRIVPTILNFVNNVNVGVIGAVGMLILLFSVFSIINNIERAFNDIWQVKKTRPFSRKLTDYLSILILGPVLVFLVLGVVASFEETGLFQLTRLPVLNWIIDKGTPIVATWVAFYFILTFVPNTHVSFISASIGAILAGTLWQLSNGMFSNFIATSYQYSYKAAIYAGLATLPLFLFWLYINWSIVLLGAEISFTHDNLDRLTLEKDIHQYSKHYIENLSLKVILLSAIRFEQGGNPPTANEMSKLFREPEPLLQSVLSSCVQMKLLLVTNEDQNGYIPHQATHSLSLAAIIDKFRSTGISPRDEHHQKAISKVVQEVQNGLFNVQKTYLGDSSLYDLVQNVTDKQKDSSA